ncbi:hypothetical protein GEMRC1_001586 [Eukaryota sp. GEM-RC1]
MSFSWASRLFSSTNRYSLQHFESLCINLDKECTKPRLDSPKICAILKDIADLILWSDRTDSIFFQCFLEHGILPKLIALPDHATIDIKIEILQTFSILISNMTNTDAIYYLLSNNSINTLIRNPSFSYSLLSSQDDVLPYYIALVKAIALRLDTTTLQFFFDPDLNDCMIYTTSVNFFDFNESHVRLAIRTLTLALFKIKLESFINFVVDQDKELLPAIEVLPFNSSSGDFQELAIGSSLLVKTDPGDVNVYEKPDFGNETKGLILANGGSRPFLKSLSETILGGWKKSLGELSEIFGESIKNDSTLLSMVSRFKASVSERFDHMLYIADVLGLEIDAISERLFGHLSINFDWILDGLDEDCPVDLMSWKVLYAVQLLAILPHKSKLFESICNTFASFQQSFNFINSLFLTQCCLLNISGILLVYSIVSLKISSDDILKILSTLFDSSSAIESVLFYCFELIQNQKTPPIAFHLIMKIFTKLLNLKMISLDQLSPHLLKISNYLLTIIGEQFLSLSSNPSVKPGYFFAEYTSVHHSMTSLPTSIDSIISDGNCFLLSHPKVLVTCGLRHAVLDESHDLYLSSLLYKFHVLKSQANLFGLERLNFQNNSKLELTVSPPNKLRPNTVFSPDNFEDSDVQIPFYRQGGAFLHYKNCSHLAICVYNGQDLVIKRVYPLLFVKAVILRTDPSSLNISTVEGGGQKHAPCRLCFANFEDTKEALGCVRTAHCDLLLNLKHEACKIFDIELPRSGVLNRAVRSRSIAQS